MNDNNVDKSVMCNVCHPVMRILQKRFNLYMGPHKIIHAAEFNVLFDITNCVATITDDI